MRFAWTTDLHLNHTQVQAWETWVKAVTACQPDGVLITGDISESDDLVLQLDRISQAVGVPIYFVLGNHDFYRSSFGATRQAVIHACRDNPLLNYLTDLSALQLSPTTFLVGEDGWGDATEGDYENSPIRLNDFPLISDFHDAPMAQWKQQLHDLGAESAKRLAVKLDAIPAEAKQALVITHVPPFRDACWYEGQTTDDDWAPFFVCGQVGQVLMRASESRPQCQFTVLCGHTHHAGLAEMSANLVVHTGAAVYGHPDVVGQVTVRGNSLKIS